MARQIVKIIRKVDIERQYAHMLNLELDYELKSLFEAMNANDEKAKEKSKKRLAEIREELSMLNTNSSQPQQPQPKSEPRRKKRRKGHQEDSAVEDTDDDKEEDLFGL